MRLPLFMGACGVLLVSAAMDAQQVVHDRPGQRGDHTNPQPFYLEQTEGMRNASGDGGWTAERSLFVIARRADGTTVRIESRGPDPAHRLRMRDIFFADGRTVTVYDALKQRTSWPDSRHGLVGDRIDDDPDACNIQAFDELGQPLERTEGLESVEGQLVVVTTQTVGGYAMTHWRAPNLACQELYYRAEKPQPDAAPTVTVETKTTKLVLGDPDPQLFAIDPAFAETKPSEALLNIVLGTGLSISDEERERIIKEGEALDRRYRGEKP
jgi:hypothetical protein